MKLKKTHFFLIILVFISFAFKDRFFEIAKQIEIYNNVFKTLNLNYIDEINPGELTNKAINNTLANLDPYTRFYNEQQVEDANIKRQGEYAGIGITTWYTKQGIVVVDVRKDYPADKAGIKIGDFIIEVNNQPLNGMEDYEKAQLLKGAPNTQKTIEFVRGDKKNKITITLDKIEINPVPFFDMIDNETGYIKLTRFTNSKATQEVRKAFIKLEEKGMKKLVFDLRHNPGGSLYDAINITNLFIEKDQKVVQTKGKLKKYNRTYKTTNLPLNLEIPIVVLIDGRSASASEIVSGSLQDYDRAVIMGERSFGKGLVQRYFKLNYGTQMKATISKYYTPSGRCIQELDYANRDPKTNEVPKFSDGKVQEFKTKKGRTVYDGGGVTPDVLLPFSELEEFTKDLFNSRAIFNYAVEYVRKNPTADSNTFKLTNKDFSDFQEYLKNQDTLFVTKQEALFKKAYQLKENKAIKSDFNHLSSTLKQDKVSKISKNKDRILYQLQKEILPQYFYEEGMYQYLLQNDESIKEAVKLLKNEKKYNKILKK